MGVIDWVATIGGAIGSVCVGVATHDLVNASQSISERIIRRAGSRLAPLDRNEQEKEWLAHLSELPTVSERYSHALGCYLAAPRMRRQSEAIWIMAKYAVPGVGVVPLDLNVNSRRSKLILHLLGSEKIPAKVKKVIIMTTAAYILIKFSLSARGRGKDEFAIFARSLKNMGKWECNLHLKSRTMDLDLSALYVACAEQPNNIGPTLKKYLEKVREVLERKPHQE